MTEWQDKLNPSVSLQPTNTGQRPTTGSILNGLGAIDFDVGNRLQSSGNHLEAMVPRSQILHFTLFTNFNPAV